MMQHGIRLLVAGLIALVVLRPAEAAVIYVDDSAVGVKTTARAEPTPGQQCNADLNLDMTVDVNDLLMVIGAWGDCPA